MLVCVAELSTDVYLSLNRIFFDIIPMSLYATPIVTKYQATNK